MARTEIVKSWARGPYGKYDQTDVADIYMQAADVGNGNQVSVEGNELVFVYNGAGTTETVTIDSTDDYPYLRESDLTSYSMATGDYACFGPFKPLGWRQADGKLYINCSHASMKIGVVQVGEQMNMYYGEADVLALPQGGMLLARGDVPGKFLGVP
jgi:hypothetical protein